MLDYVSEDIDGINDDAKDEPSQVPPITGRWTATSTYDVYMVYTPKNDQDNPNPDEDRPVDKPSKCRHQRHRSQSHRAKDSNTGTGDNETPDGAEDNEHLIEPTSEEDEWEEGEHSPGRADNEDAEDNNYMQNPKRRLASVTKTSSSQKNPSTKNALSDSSLL